MSGHSGHTRGPWIAAPYSSVVGAPVVASPSGRSVANVTYFRLGEDFAAHDAESLANAKLIAAAPDLLEALKWLCEQMVAEQGAGVSGFEDWLSPARAAIAKAVGE